MLRVAIPTCYIARSYSKVFGEYFSLQKNCPTSFIVFLVPFLGIQVYQKMWVTNNVLLNGLAKNVFLLVNMKKFDPLFDQSFWITQIILRSSASTCPTIFKKIFIFGCDVFFFDWLKTSSHTCALLDYDELILVLCR